MRWKRRLRRARRASETSASPRAHTRHRPHAGPFFIDLGVAACALAVFFAVVSTGVYWLQKPIPVVPISSSIGALPVYAFYSIVRMAIAYFLSLAFAVTYGYIAAYNPRIEPWMIAVLDILQSIPVLSFLPPVVLAMVSLIPGHQLGIEMAVILLIFTGPGVESGLQFLLLAQDHSARDAGGFAHLSLLRLAALLAAGDAVFRHRPGVELDRLGGRRLVCAHLLRNLHHGRPQLSACPAWAATSRPRPTPATCARCWPAS